MVIVVACLMATGTGTPISDCSARFQQSLTEVLRLKQTCATAMYKDCCQVIHYTCKVYNIYIDKHAWNEYSTIIIIGEIELNYNASNSQIAQVSKTLLDQNLDSGIYDIKNFCPTTPFGLNLSPVQARCNMESGGGGWIVLVRRTPDVDERSSFDRTWEEYENGFGNLSGEFWYGLKNMHCLTDAQQMEVEIEVSKINGTKLILSYGQFQVEGPSTSYTLQVSDQQHTGFDFFGYHNALKFTTKDRNDENPCAEQRNGGWWFNVNDCYNVGISLDPRPQLHQRSAGGFMPFDYAEMRVRTKSCAAPMCDN